MELYLGLFLLFVAITLIIQAAKASKASGKKSGQLYGGGADGSADQKLMSQKQVALADDLLTEIKIKFEVKRRSKDPNVHFMCVKHTGISQAQLWLSLENQSNEKVMVERIEWELWFGPLVKSASKKVDLVLSSGESKEDLSFDASLFMEEVQKLTVLAEDSSAKCFVDGKVFCRTKVGFFEKQFSMFNLTTVITGLSLAKQAEGLNTKYEMDQLTGLFQRYYIEDNLQKMMDTSLPDRPFSFLMVDMDDFKDINDSHGHLVGDEAIKMVCKHIQAAIGLNGVAVRYGGDEFCVLLQAIEKDEAEYLANKIISLVAKDSVKSDPDKLDAEDIKVNLSIGVATAYEKMGYKSLMKIADEMLYQAKKTGKNKVMVDRRSD